VVLLAEDDRDDSLLVSGAFEAAEIQTDIRWVRDGRALCGYLFRCKGYEDMQAFPMPDLVLLDLNMPRMNGFSALEEIKENEHLKEIPVVVLTRGAFGHP